jgi:hypothetical protein
MQSHLSHVDESEARRERRKTRTENEYREHDGCQCARPPIAGRAGLGSCWLLGSAPRDAKNDEKDVGPTLSGAGAGIDRATCSK